MRLERTDAAAASLPDGRVFIAGGNTGYDGASATWTATTEIYDPAYNCFVGTGGACGLVAPPPMRDSRSGATATLLRNGKVFIFGGIGACNMEIYDPAKNSLVSQDGDFLHGCPELFGTATLLSDSRIFLAGGFSCGDGWACEGRKWTALYDPAKNCLGGKGDYEPTLGATPLVIVFHIKERSGLCAAASPPLVRLGRYHAAAALLPNGKVLIAGGTGFDSEEAAKQIELYDVEKNCFVGSGGACGSTPPPSMREAHNATTAAVLPDGRVLIVGGSVEIYDPAKNCFAGTGGACGTTPPPSMLQTRSGPTMTLLADGRVFIAGGEDHHLPGQGRPFDPVSWPPIALPSTEIYDPGNNCFAGTGGACGTTPPPSMGERRAGATATLLGNGKVFIAGGGTATTEIYDPAQNCFLGANGSCRVTSGAVK